MSDGAIQADQSCIYAARAHAAQHRIAAAEAAYREVLKTAPDTPEALNFVAMCALARGEFASAERGLGRAADLDPTEPEIWKNVGIVQLAQGRGGDALDAFDRALGLEPMHFAARLHRGAALERMGRMEDAAAAYFGALAAAQSHGKWRNDMTTPPALRPVVRHAIEFVDYHRKHIFMDCMAPLRNRYGATALSRIERGLAIYLDELPADYPDPRQSCTFLQVPGLRATPFYERALFPWHALLEKQAGVIREELRGVLARPIGVEPFLGSNDSEFLQGESRLDGTRGHPQWNAFFFHHHGDVCEPNRRRCPRTAEVLGGLPSVRIPGQAPEALFSILAPGSHILQRHGATNARLVTHLPLLIPDHCALSVGGVERAWREGHCVTFDGTFGHQAWNHSDSVRVVLALDTWHPDLTEAERAAIGLLVGRIGAFRQAARVDPPPSD